MRIYGYVVMPEHVHLLVSEPEHATLADALHFLKLSFAKRLKVPQVRVRSLDANLGPVDSRIVPVASTSFWQKRYYDRNVRDARISQ
jgi:REP element-mobilizing transposase RayT